MCTHTLKFLRNCHRFSNKAGTQAMGNQFVGLRNIFCRWEDKDLERLS